MAFKKNSAALSFTEFRNIKELIYTKDKLLENGDKWEQLIAENLKKK